MVPHDALALVRARLVAALHSGRIKPGDRAPSVRRLAAALDVDPKTVHRAYRKLAAEGLVETRAGSGTFVVETAAPLAGRPPTSRLVVAVRRVRAQAAELGLDPASFARFLAFDMAGGLRGVPLAVAECNREQIDLFGIELGVALGIRPRPALLADLRARPREILGPARGIVSTDFHRAEVREIVEPYGIPVYRVSLEPSIPRILVERASHGPLVMVVSDRSFAPDFLRFLAGLGVAAEVRARVRIVEPGQAAAAFRAAPRGGSVYLSPLVEKVMTESVPARFERIPVRRHLAVASVERLRARIALDMALL